MEILDDVKTILRISNVAYDTEITDLINAAKADLALFGVLDTTDKDPLIKRAIITYVKANFGWNNPDSVKLQNSYDMLKGHLSLSTEYAYYAITFDVEVADATITFNSETLVTGTAGTAIFYVRAGNNIEYKVSADGYISVESKIDVSSSTTINVVLVEV